jgi:CheY-like chemotaxis protein
VSESIDLDQMGIKMPVMDGITAAKFIKSFRPNLPIIGQSAYATKQDIENTRDVFDDYITKPITEEKLKIVLNKFIKSNK